MLAQVRIFVLLALLTTVVCACTPRTDTVPPVVSSAKKSVPAPDHEERKIVVAAARRFLVGTKARFTDVRYKERVRYGHNSELRDILQVDMDMMSNGQPVPASMSVEVGTGRILGYETDVRYGLEKNKGRRKLLRSDMMSRSAAIEKAVEYIKLARLPLDGLRVRVGKLRRPMGDENYYSYDLTFANTRRFDGAGEVELPDFTVVCMDAETGELSMFYHRSFPPVVDLPTPKVSSDEAIAIVRPIARRWCGYHEGMTPTAVLEVYPGRSPTYGEQILAWRVTFTDGAPEVVGWTDMAMVDARTGKTIE